MSLDQSKKACMGNLNGRNQHKHEKKQYEQHKIEKLTG